MTEIEGWKRYLLASGVPLEHQVAKALADSGFHVEAEYEYLRSDTGQEKVFSVDVSARWFGDNENFIPYTLSVLAECKHRARDKTILLFEDPNEEGINAMLGHTVAVMDDFVAFHIDANKIYDYEQNIPFVYKAVEIHKGGAVEQDIRHGFNQLRYAAPSLWANDIMHQLSGHPDDRNPHLFAKMLVTNSPLRILRKGVSLSMIEQAKSPESVSYPADVAIMCSGIGPDLERHCRETLKILSGSGVDSSARRISYQLAEAGKRLASYHDNAHDYIRNLRKDSYNYRQMSAQSFIVSLDGLEQFVRSLKSLVRDSYRRRSKKPR